MIDSETWCESDTGNSRSTTLVEGIMDYREEEEVLNLEFY